MNFLFPTFLWVLLAIAVPVAVHLFNFRKLKKVYFSNVALLKTVDTKTSSFRRLKHWLILACRILAIAALVFAFAQPFIAVDAESARSRKGIFSFYLDNSFSMESELNTRRLLDVASGKLTELLLLFRNQGSIQLVTNDFSAQETSAYPADKIRDRLTTLSLSATPRSLDQVVARQKHLSADFGAGKQNSYFLFSDFQKSTVGDLSSIRIDSTERLFLVPVQAPVAQNVFVDSVWLNTPFIRELQNNILHVKLSNSGNSAVKSLVVKLFIDDSQVSTASVSLPPGGSANASFNFNIRGAGYKRGKITFDDFPVTFDNDYYFVLNASPKINILHLYENRNSSDFVENVYQNDSLFSIRSFAIGNVDVGQFTGSDLIVVEGVSRFSGAITGALQDWVRKGGSLALIPSGNPDLNSLTGLLSNMGVSGIRMLEDGQAPIAVSPPSKSTPFFSDVFEQTIQSENLSMPTALPVWQWANGGSTLLSLVDGKSYLAQSSVGLGKLYLWGGPLDPAYGNFAQNALFVPVMYKMAAMSVRTQRTAFTFDENPIVLNVSTYDERSIFKLKRGDLEFTPIQRLVGNRLFLELPKSGQLDERKNTESGYFELVRNGKTEQVIALNHNHDESRLDFYSPAALREIFAGKKNVTVYDQVDDADFIREFEKRNLGISLWRYFLYAALLFLLAEILLIRFMK